MSCTSQHGYHTMLRIFMCFFMFDVKLKSGTKVHSTRSNVEQKRLRNHFPTVIILLHGFPDNNRTFDGILPALLENFNEALILSPLMRGYEKLLQYESSWKYRTRDFAEDVKNFITENLDYELSKIHLIGHDWGAITAFKTASLYPDLISSISTLAIPYLSNLHLWDLLKVPEQLWYLSYFLSMQFSWLYSKLYLTKNEDSYLNRLWEYWSPGWNYSHDDIEDVRNTLIRHETVEHATAYYRCLFNPLFITDVKWYVDFDKVPTLLLGGKNDGCMSYKLYEIERKKLEKKAKVVLLDGVGHFLQREDPQRVARVLVDWLQAQEFAH